MICGGATSGVHLEKYLDYPYDTSPDAFTEDI